jgi:hypothetical protein
MNRSRYYALLALMVALVAIFVVGAIHRGGPAGAVPDDGARAPTSRTPQR